MPLALSRFSKAERAMLLASSVGAVFAVAAFAAAPQEKLEDVQIGERGDLMRVALICSDRCSIEPGEGVEFRILGVAAELDVDLSAKSALADRLTIAPAAGASVLRLSTRARVNEARVVDCDSDSGPAPCIEYRFEASGLAAAGPQKPAALANAALPPRPPMRTDDEAPLATGAAKTAASDNSHQGEEPPFIGAIVLTPNAARAPALRDKPASGLVYLPEFAPPERFAPPAAVRTPADPESTGAENSEIGNHEIGNNETGNVEIGRPSLIAIDRAQTLGQGAGVDIKREASEILGKSFSVGACEGAKARLMGDAWALDAMIDLAFCKAADGRLEEADADLARLLNYTPDNYEALVGRGLIALARGDRAVGLAFYQDALNALPPIAESDRIAAAMSRQ